MPLSARRLVKRLAARTALAHGDDVAPEALWHHHLLLLLLLLLLHHLLFSPLLSLSRLCTLRHTGRANEIQRESQRSSPYIRTREPKMQTRTRVSTPGRSTRARHRNSHGKTRSTVPHESRLTLANVKWRPLLTTFSTLVRICPTTDSATTDVTGDRAAHWPSRSRDPSRAARDWSARGPAGTTRLLRRREYEACRTRIVRFRHTDSPFHHGAAPRHGRIYADWTLDDSTLDAREKRASRKKGSSFFLGIFGSFDAA